MAELRPMDHYDGFNLIESVKSHRPSLVAYFLSQSGSSFTTLRRRSNIPLPGCLQTLTFLFAFSTISHCSALYENFYMHEDIRMVKLLLNARGKRIYLIRRRKSWMFHWGKVGGEFRKKHVSGSKVPGESPARRIVSHRLKLLHSYDSLLVKTNKPITPIRTYLRTG